MYIQLLINCYPNTQAQTHIHNKYRPEYQGGYFYSVFVSRDTFVFSDLKKYPTISAIIVLNVSLYSFSFVRTRIQNVTENINVIIDISDKNTVLSFNLKLINTHRPLTYL